MEIPQDADFVDYEELCDAEMKKPSHIVFRISSLEPDSLKPRDGGALYARANIRSIDAFRRIQDEILTQMNIDSSIVMTVEYHRDGSSERRSLDDLFDDSDFLCGLASHESKHWTLFLNIIGSGPQSEEEPQDITVKLHFLQGSWDKAADGWKLGSLKKHRWEEDSIQCPYDLVLDDLPNHIAKLIRSKAEQDSEWAELMVSRQFRVGFISGIHFNGRLLSLEDGKIRIPTLLELFKDPEEPLLVQVTVVLDCERASRKVPETKNLVYRICSPSTWTYYRLGNTMTDTKETSTSTEEGTNRTRPHSDFALLVHPGAAKDSWNMFSTHVYDFKDYCIGDMDDFRPRNLCKKHDFFPPFEELGTADNKDEMMELLKAYSAEDKPEQVGSGVPFLPGLSFNPLTPFNAPALGLGVDVRSWTNEHHIDLAVRCFCHLEGVWDFPSDMVLENVGIFTSPEKVRKAIRSIVVKGIPRAGDEGTYASTLFEEERNGEWEMELWIMAQMADVKPKERRLYLWSKDQEDKGYLLAIFFDQRSWDEGNRQLYVEAHIVPKGKVSVITGNVLHLV